MDSQFWEMLIKLIIVLPLVLGIIYISLKYGGIKLQNIENGKFIKILERVPISKENYLLVVKIGKKGYVMSSASGKNEIIVELNSDELMALEDSSQLPQYNELKESLVNIIKRKKGRSK